MKILKGYVFRMYPDKKQEEFMGCSRFIYNLFWMIKLKNIKKVAKAKHFLN